MEEKLLIRKELIGLTDLVSIFHTGLHEAERRFPGRKGRKCKGWDLASLAAFFVLPVLLILMCLVPLENN